ncbi:MAG: adenosylmethionine decarboxylase, partial [Deltaproteobacteria bacterium]|nr:adenosylmethionine decarboxylase [Deltaproteobacteria bacterium]
EKVEEIMLEAVRVSGAEIIKPVFHKFKPHGVSGVVVIAESHFSIHTWPEYGYCAVDIFTCGTDVDNESAVKYVREQFGSGSIYVMEVKRGILDVPLQKLRHKPSEA